MLGDIDALMAEYEVDALFLTGNSLLNPDLYYVSRFLTVDDFYFIKLQNQPGIIAATDLICERARRYSPVREFHSVSPVRNQAVKTKKIKQIIINLTTEEVHHGEKLLCDSWYIVRCDGR